MSYLRKIAPFLLVMLLVLSVAAVYGRVGTFGFVDFDDGVYVRDNHHVTSGLSPDGLRWAFSLDSSWSQGTYYHPLAWVSHMTDVQLFGVNPGRHHLVNLAFHLLNTALLFLVLWKMTRAYWQSLLVAAMFGLHPMNVETVAWITERKNLLSTMFWLLAMLSWWHYTRKPGVSRYLLTLLAYVCGLLSKPTLVTLPFVLLLMDYWPLGRFGADSGYGRPGAVMRKAGLLVLEKAPFLFLGLLSMGISLLSLSREPESQAVSLGLRLAQAAAVPALYLIKLVLPLDLAVFHPYPTTAPVWQASAALLLILSLLGLAFSQRKRHPFLLTGMLWYLVTLVPVLGIFQGGRWPAYAERWVYVPYIGVFIVIAWGMPLLIRKMGGSKPNLIIFPATILAFWGGLTWIQAGYWKDSLILFSHAVEATTDNFMMESNLGNAYKDIGLPDLAMPHYKKALIIEPGSAEVHINIGNILAQQGDRVGAVKHIEAALALMPENAQAYLAIGCSLAALGEQEKALACYARAVEMNPGNPQAYYSMGIAYARMKKADQALAAFRKAVLIKPDYADAYCGLAETLAHMGRAEEAIQGYREALRIKPDLGFARMSLKRLEDAAHVKAGDK